MTAQRISRRNLLAGLGGGAVLTLCTAVPAAAGPTADARKQAYSNNGWPTLAASPPATRIEGSDLVVSVLPGLVATVLVHCLRRFYYEVESSLHARDVQGHMSAMTVGAPYETNHLSGTAVAVKRGMYPSGVPDGFTFPQVSVIRDILADCAGVVWWGGDGQPVKQSHFQIDVPPDDPRLRAVADGSPGGTANLVRVPACWSIRCNQLDAMLPSIWPLPNTGSAAGMSTTKPRELGDVAGSVGAAISVAIDIRQARPARF